MSPSGIQIAGVIDRDEALMLVRLGVTWLGFPLGLDHHREDLTAEQAAAIIRALAGEARAVLITYLNQTNEVLGLAEKIGVSAVQLHGPVTAATVAELRRRRPHWLWWKSVVIGRPGGGTLEHQVREFSPHVDAFLTDTFDPATGASGATGKIHDWRLSRRLVEISPKPVILAGGLTPENVGEAIAAVGPWGVDAHTGVEDETGRKCPVKVEAFVRQARRAWGSI